jgi:hypothetical protein
MIFLVVPVLFILCFLAGNHIAWRLKLKADIGFQIVIGLIGYMAVFHVIAIPFIIFELRFDVLYCIFMGVVAFVSVLSIKRLWGSRKEMVLQLKQLGAGFLEHRWLWCIVIACIVYQMVMSGLLEHYSSDDSFYVTVTNTVIGRNRVSDCDPILGSDQFVFDSAHKLVSYEILLAVICKTVNINAALLCHTLLNFFFIPLAYYMVYRIGRLLKVKNPVLFVLICSILNLFGGRSSYLQGTFLLMKIWQGKSVLATIILPAVFCIFLEFLDRKEIQKRDVVRLIGILYAGMCCTCVGVYLIPLAYAGMAFVYLLATKNWRDIAKLAIPAFVMLPVVILVYILLISQPYGFDGILYGAEELNYLKEFEKIGRSQIHIVLYGIATLYLLKNGSRLERLFYGLYPVILFLTVLNPLFTVQVASYITGTSVYWRLFWLLPVNYAVACANVRWICSMADGRYRKFAVAGLCLIIAAAGRTVYNERFFQMSENMYKVPQDVIQIADKVVDENKEGGSVLLAPTELGVYFRQYTDEIVMAWARKNDVLRIYSTVGRSDDYQKLSEIYRDLYEKEQFDEGEPAQIKNALDYFKIRYVVLPNDDKRYHWESLGWKKEEVAREYSLYSVENTEIVKREKD